MKKTVRVSDNAIRVGDTVLTKWDDNPTPIAGEVLSIHRGHREKKFHVSLETGTVERVGASQIIEVYYRSNQ